MNDGTMQEISPELQGVPSQTAKRLDRLIYLQNQHIQELFANVLIS